MNGKQAGKKLWVLYAKSEKSIYNLSHHYSECPDATFFFLQAAYNPLQFVSKKSAAVQLSEQARQQIEVVEQQKRLLEGISQRMVSFYPCNCRWVPSFFINCFFLFEKLTH